MYTSTTKRISCAMYQREYVVVGLLVSETGHNGALIYAPMFDVTSSVEQPFTRRSWCRSR